MCKSVERRVHWAIFLCLSHWLSGFGSFIFVCFTFFLLIDSSTSLLCGVESNPLTPRSADNRLKITPRDRNHPRPLLYSSSLNTCYWYCCFLVHLFTPAAQTDEWMNEWLRQLAEHPQSRENFARVSKPILRTVSFDIVIRTTRRDRSRPRLALWDLRIIKRLKEETN